MRTIYKIIGAFSDVDSDLFPYYEEEIELTATTEEEAIKEAEALQEKHDAEAYKHCPERLVVERAPCYVNSLFEVTLTPEYLLNKAGFEVLKDFLHQNLKNGNEVCQERSALNAWAADAENSILSGTPQIEIRSSDSVTGRPEILYFDLERHFDKRYKYYNEDAVKVEI